MTTATPSLQELERRLEEQKETIDNAIRDVRGNKPAHIESVEQDVSDICTQITKMSVEDAQKLQTVMLSVIAGLEELAQELAAFQERQDQASNDA